MEGAEMWVVDGSEGRLIVCRCRVKVVPSYEPYLRALVGTTLASMQILARVCTATLLEYPYELVLLLIVYTHVSTKVRS